MFIVREKYGNTEETRMLGGRHENTENTHFCFIFIFALKKPLNTNLFIFCENMSSSAFRMRLSEGKSEGKAMEKQGF